MHRPASADELETQSPGALIRHWRGARGLSQMALALDTDVSPRHMSFVETGRSRPSRELVLRIAKRLAIPPREENVLLEAAGYARRHRESRLDDADLRPATEVLRFLLDRHRPNGALVFDGVWDIVMTNAPHRLATELLLEGQDPPDAVKENLLRLTFHPRGLRPWIANWHVVGPTLLDRAERELTDAPSNVRLRRLLDEVRSYGPVRSSPGHDDVEAGVLLPVHIRRGGLDVKLFSVLSTIGTALDLTLQELRLETFFPADAESAAAWAALSEPPST